MFGYCPIPQMSVFMYRMLWINHILIKIDIAVFINKAVDLTFRCGELHNALASRGKLLYISRGRKHEEMLTVRIRQEARQE